ncbi:hypothetical protein [Streptomyces sp. NPDC086838]|uniref:hypothetical protein n=1 Tax=Streptomyces sp. NPDC086838 TaxID=3365762 RepID=UPI003803EA1D
MGIRDELGKDLAAQAGPGGLQTVSATVIDVTADGLVNLTMRGATVYGVACADSYRNRRAGDTVAVRRGAIPVVLWRLGADPGDTDEDTIKALAQEIALDAQVVRAARWGTTEPAGAGWQGPMTLYMRTTSDGQVELYGQLTVQTEPPPPPTPPRTPSPVTVSATSSGSWRGGRPDDYASNPMQGDWTGSGNRRGAWFYGSQIADACAGKTVASMKVQFTRARGSGSNSKRPLHVYLHGYTAPPSGQLALGAGPEELLQLSVGATGTATLPASWRAALASGSARGLAIYASGRSDYMAVTDGRITITFS